MSQLAREAFAEALNKARIDHHVSVRQAARIAGVPPATMQGWLNGRHFPTPALRHKYLALVEHLGLAEEFRPILWDEEPSAAAG